MLKSYLNSKDQLNETVKISFPPNRIISLVPSQTELLYHFGLDQEVVGITKFCVHPNHWLKEKVIIGGTKNFNFNTIKLLEPDLLIGNKEENYLEGIELLKKDYPVWMSDITTWEEALDMINSLGLIVGKVDQAKCIIKEIETAFASLQSVSKKSVLYLIWKKPWMAAGKNTFINTLLDKIGLVNCLDENFRYPELSDEQIKQLNPEYIFLSSEPYPFQEKHLNNLKAISPSSTIMLVDGELFSWYGSRLQLAPDYFNGLKLQ